MSEEVKLIKDSLKKFLNSYSSYCPKCDYSFFDTDKTADILSELFNEPWEHYAKCEDKDE